jgi:hypothetical protein
MARRKGKRKRRSPKTTSLLTLAESYAFATILTEGAMGTNPIAFVTGKADLGTSTVYAISLSDIATAPALAFSQIKSNVSANWQGMFLGSLVTKVAFKGFRRLFRANINAVNRAVKPLALGIRL